MVSGFDLAHRARVPVRLQALHVLSRSREASAAICCHDRTRLPSLDIGTNPFSYIPFPIHPKSIATRSYSEKLMASTKYLRVPRRPKTTDKLARSTTPSSGEQSDELSPAQPSHSACFLKLADTALREKKRGSNNRRSTRTLSACCERLSASRTAA